MEDGAAMLRTDWLGGKWLEGWEIAIKLPCGRFPQLKEVHTHKHTINKYIYLRKWKRDINRKSV
jgi:hypothetical protein